MIRGTLVLHQEFETLGDKGGLGKNNSHVQLKRNYSVTTGVPYVSLN